PVLGATPAGRPRLLPPDAPPTSRAPHSRLELWAMIRALVAGGTAVLLSTQYLEEADHLASQVAIIDHGRLVAQGTPGELKPRTGRSVIEVHVRETDGLAPVANALAAIAGSAPVIDVSTRRVRAGIDADTTR